jgi:hypothetical protein
MKRKYTFGLILVMASTQAMAQNGPGQTASKLQRQLPEPTMVAPLPHPGTTAAERDVIFEEDFANGLSGNNGVGAWTFEGPNGDVWRYTHTGPNGAFNDLSEKINSDTDPNGFVIFNSDSVNTNFSTNPITPADPRVPLTGSLVSPVLDLSANPGVEIRFQQRFRYCCTTTTGSGHFLEVSTDGGSTWPVRMDVEMGKDDNVDDGTLTFANSLQGAISANPANVRFRFTQDGANGISAYHWQIDDISINTLPPNELIMENAFTSQFGGGYEFGRVPQGQMGNTIDIGADVINYGANAQDNVEVNVSLTDAANVEVASTTITLGTIVGGDTMLAETQLTLPDPMPTGIYTAHFTMTSDSIAEDFQPNNNAKDRAFSVTDHLYSIDGVGVYPTAIATSEQVGTTSFADNTQNVRFLNYFEVHEDATFYGVEIGLGSNTDANSLFSVSVYDTTEIFAATPNMSNTLAESDFHVITTAEKLAKKASVTFLDPIFLPVGGYFVSANLYQADGNDIFILDDTTVPQPSVASMLYTPVDDNGQFLYGGNGTAWAVRISTDASMSVKDTEGLTGVSLYPNPTTGLVHIRTAKAEPTTVEVRNVLGELVKTATFNGMENSMDLRGNAAGLYSVRISNGSQFAVGRITLK